MTDADGTSDPPPTLAPRVEGAITLRTGRRIGYAEYGPPRGRPVLWFHGTPGGRRQIPPAVRVAAQERNVRIIALERPGIGASSPHRYDSILEWGADVEECVDQLGIDRFAVVGLSGGGPYVLACAVRLPERMVAGALIGGIAPTRGEDAAVGGAVELTARLSSVIELLQKPLGVVLWAAVWGVRPLAPRIFDLYVHFSPTGDQAVFSEPGMKEMFIGDLLKGSRRQFGAPVSDLRLFGRHWGFSPRDVKVPIFLWQGDEDYIVPVAHGEHLAEMIPRSELRVQPGAAHLANLTLGDEVLGAILSEWPDDADDG